MTLGVVLGQGGFQGPPWQATQLHELRDLVDITDPNVKVFGTSGGALATAKMRVLQLGGEGMMKIVRGEVDGGYSHLIAQMYAPDLRFRTFLSRRPDFNVRTAVPIMVSAGLDAITNLNPTLERTRENQLVRLLTARGGICEPTVARTWLEEALPHEFTDSNTFVHMACGERKQQVVACNDPSMVPDDPRIHGTKMRPAAAVDASIRVRGMWSRAEHEGMHLEDAQIVSGVELAVLSGCDKVVVFEPMTTHPEYRVDKKGRICNRWTELQEQIELYGQQGIEIVPFVNRFDGFGRGPKLLSTKELETVERAAIGSLHASRQEVAQLARMVGKPIPHLSPIPPEDFEWEQAAKVREEAKLNAPQSPLAKVASLRPRRRESVAEGIGIEQTLVKAS